MITTESGSTSKGHFSGEYKVELSPYRGMDFSRRCLVFPGQSAAHPGMMKEEVLASQVCMERFAKADALCQRLGLPAVSLYVLSPEKLNVSQLAQLRNPALFTLEVALFEHLTNYGLKPAMITAHSFGEYAATVASGISEFEDIFKVVVQRDLYSPAANTLGVMIVAGAPVEAVAKALARISYELSNINSPKQVVISVAQADESAAHSAMKSARIAAKTLQEMTQPFHTRWMQPTSLRLAEYLREANLVFSAPKIPVVSSVGAELLDALAAKNSSARLASQVCEPVLFPLQIKKCMEYGAINFIEVGPGEICSQFIKACLGDSFFKVTPLSRFMTAKEKSKSPRVLRLRSEKSNLLGTLSKVIAAVTGYNVDEISVEQNFQEDLGIDSIRKAEIVFKFMESMKSEPNSPDLLQVNLAQLKRIEDVIEHFENVAEASSVNPVNKKADFHRFEATWVQTELTDFERLNLDESKSKGLRFVELSGSAPNDLAFAAPGSIIAFTLACESAKETSSEPGQLEQIFKTRLQPWIQELRAISARGYWPVNIALITEPGSDIYRAGLDGLFRSWVQENGFAAYRKIEASLQVADLERRVRDEFLDQRFTDIKYEGPRRLVKKWRSVGLSHEAAPLGETPVVISLGGSRGIGAVILEKLVSDVPAARLYIIGRSEETSEKTARTLATLRTRCSTVNYLQADVRSELRSVLDRVCLEHGKIDVILNGAGQEFSRSLKAKSDEEIWEEFVGKVAPAKCLAEASRELPIAHIINYSSVAAVFGNQGQSIYALGNQVQVSLGEREAVSQRTRVTSLVLPAWDNLGMTENAVILNGLKAAGVALLPAARGAELVVEQIRSGQGKQVAFLDQTDLRSYDCALTDRQAHENFFSRPLMIGSPIKLNRLNRKDQPYLEDHVINGNVIYPGSSALALFFYAGYQYFKSVPTVENFEVRSFLAPDLEISNCDLTLENLGGGRLKAQIASRHVVHFVCELIEGDGQAQLTPPKPFFDRGSTECQPLYDNNHITLGKHFQLAHRLWLNADRDLLQESDEQSLLRYTPIIAFDRLAQWFESALQVMGCQLLWHTKCYWVPNRIGRVVARFDRRLSSKLSYQVEIEQQANGVALAHSRAMNEAGEVVFEFQKIEDIEVGRDDSGGQFKLKDTERQEREVEAYV